MVEAPEDPAGEVRASGTLTPMRLVATLVGLCLLVVAAVLWAFLGRAPETVNGEGIILPVGGYTELGTRISGTVGFVHIAPGDQVHEGEAAVAVRDDADGRMTVLRSPVTGTVVDVRARSGRFTSPGEPLALIDPADRRLRVSAFLPAAAAETVAPGMAAYVSPSDAPAAQYGFIEGRVVSVAPTAVSRERVLTLVGDNAELADYWLGRGPVTEATIEMAPGDTPTGVTWTIGTGPTQPLDGGTLVAVEVVTRDGNVVDWMVP